MLLLSQILKLYSEACQSLSLNQSQPFSQKISNEKCSVGACPRQQLNLSVVDTYSRHDKIDYGRADAGVAEKADAPDLKSLCEPQKARAPQKG